MINIILAEDHKIVRNGIKMLISAESQFNVSADAADGKTVVELLAQNIPCDLVLADLIMPQMDGMELLETLRSTHPQVKVVFLSMVNDVFRISEAIKAGASGYLRKDSDAEELIFAIKFAMQGEVYISSRLTREVLNIVTTKDAPEGESLSKGLFTERELEVLQLISEGMTNHEMAEKLFLSKRTIEGHRQELLKKTGAKNTASLIRKAVMDRLIKFS